MPGYPNSTSVTVTDVMATIDPAVGNVAKKYVWLVNIATGVKYGPSAATDSSGNWSLAAVDQGIYETFYAGESPVGAVPTQWTTAGVKGYLVSIASNPASAIAASTAVPSAGTTLTGGSLGGSLTDWGGGFYNITSPANPSGAADATNTNDATPSIAAAITAAQSDTNPGLVWVPKGTFKWASSLSPSAAFYMMGPGTLKKSAAVRINFFTTNPAGSGSIFAYFTIDGNLQAGGNNQGVSINGPSDCLLYAVTVKNNTDSPIRLAATAGSLQARHRVENCIVTSYGASGILVDSNCHGARIRNNSVYNTIAGTGAHAIQIGAASAGAADSIVEGNYINPGVNAGSQHAIEYFSVTSGTGGGHICANNRIVFHDDAIDVEGGHANTVVIGNVCTFDGSGHTGGTGIFIDADGCSVIGNRIINSTVVGITCYGANSANWTTILGNHVSATAVGAQVALGSPTAGVTHVGTIFQGNTIVNGAGTTVGLQLYAGLDWAVIADNVVLGNGGGPLTDSATGQNIVIRNNIGLNPKGNLAAPSIPTTAAVFGNPKHYDCMVYIAGGTLTAIGLGGCALPVNAAFSSAGTGGTLANNTAFFYRVTALNAAGETLASTETSTTTPAGANTCTVTVNWGSVAGASGYNVYGRTTGAELKIASNIQALSFVDNGSVTPSGALPGSDTTGNTAVGITAAAAAGSVHTLRVPAMSSIKLTYTVAPTWTWFGD